MIFFELLSITTLFFIDSSYGPSNASSSILTIDAGTVIFSHGTFENAFDFITFIFCPNAILTSILEHPENASFSMISTESGIFTSTRLLQFLNIASEIVFIFLGRFTFTILDNSNIFLPNFVTLSGISTLSTLAV